jgi:hypothetical protein
LLLGRVGTTVGCPKKRFEEETPMRRLLAGVLVVFSAFGNLALSQQLTSPAPVNAAPVAAAAPPPPNTLLDGTAVKLRLSENLSSATAKAGQSVPFEVLEEVDVQGMPVIAL